MKRITLAWALTLCSFITFIACSSPDVGERSVSIIPAPAQMTVGEGTFTIHPGIEIGYGDGRSVETAGLCSLVCEITHVILFSKLMPI